MTYNSKFIEKLKMIILIQRSDSVCNRVVELLKI